jgi:molecular chaperone HscB
VNHFEIFGLPPSVDLDVPSLEAKYRELSLKFHPDRVPPAQRLDAVQKTTSLNAAIKVLKDPARRAVHLLELQGVDLERVSMPMDFLEKILEQREQLEVAKGQKNLAKVRGLAAEIGHESDDALRVGLEALRRGDAPAATAALAKVRYSTRFMDEVEAIEEAAA